MMIVPIEALTTKRCSLLHHNLELCKSGILILLCTFFGASKWYSVSYEPELGSFLIRPLVIEITDDVIHVF